MKKLLKAVKKAIDLHKADGISGWGLFPYDISQKIGGKVIDLGGGTGCTSDTCNHFSHGSYANYGKWIPPEGSKLTILGCNEHEDGEQWYYHLQCLEKEYFLVLDNPKHYHSDLKLIEPEDIPAYILVNFAEV